MGITSLTAAVVGFVVGLFVLLAVIVGVSMGIAYLYMLLFVNWLKYDYVTVSSVWFILLIIGIILQGMTHVLFAEERGAAFFGLVIQLLVYPLSISAGLKLYEARNAPAISKALNVVGLYRHDASVPLHWVAQGFASLGPTAAHAVASIDHSPLLTGIVCSVVTAATTQLLRMFGWLSGDLRGVEGAKRPMPAHAA